jgi:serine/threonine protein kinase
VGIPFENSSIKHLRWIVPSKFNLALVKKIKTDEEVVLKLHDVKLDYETELNFLKVLNHLVDCRFVVKLIDAEVPIEGSQEQRYGIVLEVLGDNLHDYLSRKPHLNQKTRVALALNLVEAVAAIHRAGVAHCDLKPHQVCFTRNPGIELKLIDFDSACYIESFKPLDRFTVTYAAPEVIHAEAAGKLSTFIPTKGVDLWPLGLMLAQIFHSP